MATKEKFSVEHVDGNQFRIIIPENVKNIGKLILYLTKDKIFEVKNVSYSEAELSQVINVRFIGDECVTFEKIEGVCDFIRHTVMVQLPELAEAPCISEKDRDLYEAVNEKATEFYERDEEKHAVFLLMMDKKTKHINGCILGERNNIMSGIAHSLSKDEHLLMDVIHVTQQLLLEGAIDALKEIKNKSKK